jgi:hypothetical protein
MNLTRPFVCAKHPRVFEGSVQAPHQFHSFPLSEQGFNCKFIISYIPDVSGSIAH